MSEHFGEAPFFGLVTVRTADGQVQHQELRTNPHLEEEKGKGLRVGEWLVTLKTDVVLLREIIPHRGPAYVFRDAGIEARVSRAQTLSEAIGEQVKDTESPE